MGANRKDKIYECQRIEVEREAGGQEGGPEGGVQEIFSGGWMGNNGGYGYEEGAELRVVTKWWI